MNHRKLLFIAILLFGIIVLSSFNPEDYVWMPKCAFKLVTGLSCPGCGLQRAVHSALHGQFLKAIQYNYFLVLSGPYALLLILERWILPSSSFQMRLRRICESSVTAYCYVTLFFVWLVVRNVLDI